MKVVNVNELNSLLKNKGVLVLDVFAEWCGPCKMLAPVLEELSKQNKDITFVKMDSEVSENASFLRDLKVSSIPELFYYKDGKIMHRQVGFLPGDIIMEKVKEIA